MMWIPVGLRGGGRLLSVASLHRLSPVRHGGNLFAGTRRLTAEEHARTKADVFRALEDLGVTKFGSPPEVSDKADLVREFKGDVEPYGDVDVTVGVPDLRGLSHLGQQVRRRLGSRRPTPLHLRATVASFLTDEGYQVDLTFCYENQCDFLIGSKSHNDYTGIIGRLLSKMHLKVTDVGLVLKIEKKREGDSTYPREYCIDE